MEFSQLQKLVIEVIELYCARFNISLDVTYAHLKLYEEVGEFTQAALIHQKLVRPEKFSDVNRTKAAIAEELTDIIGMVILNAYLLEIDLEEAFTQKWFSQLVRGVENPEAGPQDSV